MCDLWVNSFDVETKKINRKITQLNKIIAEMGHSEEREAEMDALQLNLLYTTHFPRDIKYVSLYPKDDSETSSEMRTKILELIKKAKKSGEIEKEGFALRFNAPAAEPGIAVEETQDDFFM